MIFLLLFLLGLIFLLDNRLFFFLYNLDTIVKFPNDINALGIFELILSDAKLQGNFLDKFGHILVAICVEVEQHF